MSIKKMTLEFLRGVIMVGIFVMAMLGMVVLMGCPEADIMVMDAVTQEPAEMPPTTVGEVKEPEEPATGTDTTPPAVMAVEWYADADLTEMITEDSVINPGNTIYTVVMFSEPVQVVVADDNSSRPALFSAVDGKISRYGVVDSTDDLTSGACAPLNNESDAFLCKYTVPEGSLGIFGLEINVGTADLAGNRLPERAEYSAPAMIIRPDTTPPAVIAVEWYADADLAEMITEDSVINPGHTIYTVVMFSEPVQVVVADDNSSRPALFSAVDGKTSRYGVVDSTDDLTSGACAPLNNESDAFLCAHTVPEGFLGTLALQIATETEDLAGNRLPERVEYEAPTTVTPKPLLKPLLQIPIDPWVYLDQPYNFSRETVERLIQWHAKQELVTERLIDNEISLDQFFKEANRIADEMFGIDSKRMIVLLEIYIAEYPEAAHFRRGWERQTVGIAFLIVKEANPGVDPDGEEFEELFRQKVLDGTIILPK